MNIAKFTKDLGHQSKLMPLPPPPLDRLTLLVTALVTLTLATALALPAAVHAQTQGQEACPDGVTEKGGNLVVKNVEATQATIGGFLNGYGAADIRTLPEVSGDSSDWDLAILYSGVRGYGYAESDRDARSFGNNQVRVQDGDLIHGAWFHAGTAGRFIGPALRDSTVHSLIPSTTYVVQLVVGELRDGNDVVTDQFVSTAYPVLVQKCFQTAASPS